MPVSHLPGLGGLVGFHLDGGGVQYSFSGAEIEDVLSSPGRISLARRLAPSSARLLCGWMLRALRYHESAEPTCFGVRFSNWRALSRAQGEIGDLGG